MGRSPCCDKVGLKRGPWTPEEDQKLLAYIEEHGHGSWRALPAKAGLQRCGKSCRLRWTNYLRPDIKRGKFSLQEEQTIIQLHALLGNRWSAIATHLPKRTDNEIKNYWNTHLKKRLTKMGIDPVTHKPRNDALLSSDGQTKTSSNLSHMAQWESARLEAETRLVRESKLRSQFSTSSLKAWTNTTSIGWPSKSSNPTTIGVGSSIGIGSDLESPTSSLTFSENNAPAPTSAQMINSMFELVRANSSDSSETLVLKDDDDHHQGHLNDNNCVSFTSTLHENMVISVDHHGVWTPESMRAANNGTNLHGLDHIMEEGFTNLLVSDHSSGRSADLSDSANKESGSSEGNGNGGSEDYYEDNKNYWSCILNLVSSSPSDSTMF